MRCTACEVRSFSVRTALGKPERHSPGRGRASPDASLAPPAASELNYAGFPLRGAMVSSISVIGLGKLGSPLVACFAARGFRVHAVDADSQKVEQIAKALPPVHEPGLAELLQEGAHNISATQDTQAAVRDSDVTFIVVGTPSEPDGGFSLRYATPACEAIGRALATKDSYHLVVLTSTVMPGSTGSEIRETLERASGKLCGRDFGLCY